MLMSKYEPFFFNSNFKEAFGTTIAYRGELVLKEGEVADAQGRRKPPLEVMKQAIVLTEGDSLKMLSGSLDELQFMTALIDKYSQDIGPDTLVVMFVVNIDQPFIAPVGGASAVFIPLVQGMTWNELIDLVALEKGDFKGQGAAEKVVTLYQALKSHTFKYPVSTLDIELTRTNTARRETHGAV